FLMAKKENADNTRSYLKKVLILVLIVMAVTLMVMFVGQVIDTLLVIFAGILLGTILRAARDGIHRLLHIGHKLSLVVVVVLFLGIISSAALLLAPDIYNQVNDLREEVPATWETVKENISGFGWGRELAEENPRVTDFFETPGESKNTGEDHDMTSSILGGLSTVAAILAGFVLVIIIAIYIAAEPQLYTEGFIRLFPRRRRKRVVEIMDEISRTIQWWLVGQLASMVILGTLATFGLWLLGVPYPLLLGTFTAVMTFIPNLGPIIAVIPTLLIALTVGVDTAIYAAIFYTVLQSIEGYFITPMIHRHAISVPPVLIITVQFLLYYLVGFMGVFLAMPLMGIVMVLVKRLYIEDILNDPLEEHTDYDTGGETIF
ncbi:MAG TPA: AI-2E family transporter, partial [Fodinibius sp.]|nr:AI-2E family transporter [Fodinibius sp.]